MKRDVITVMLTVFATVVLGAFVTSPAPAKPPGIGPDANGAYFFHSPSGRLHCGIFPPGNRWLRDYQAGCQGPTNTVTATESDCRRKWGRNGMAMVLHRDGAHSARGGFECQSQGLFVGGTTADGTGTGRVVKPVLPYGQSVTAGPVTCTMRTSGVTCRSNRTGHGFVMALQSHRGF